jgi:hypothetical protein
MLMSVSDLALLMVLHLAQESAMSSETLSERDLDDQMDTHLGTSSALHLDLKLLALVLGSAPTSDLVPVMAMESSAMASGLLSA